MKSNLKKPYNFIHTIQHLFKKKNNGQTNSKSIDTHGSYKTERYKTIKHNVNVEKRKTSNLVLAFAFKKKKKHVPLCNPAI